MSEIIDALNQLEREKSVSKELERMYLWKHIWTVRLVRSQLYARRKL